MLGWPKIYKLAHAFQWEYRYKRLKLAELLGQRGVFLTVAARRAYLSAVCRFWCAIRAQRYWNSSPQPAASQRYASRVMGCPAASKRLCTSFGNRSSLPALWFAVSTWTRAFRHSPSPFSFVWRIPIGKQMAVTNDGAPSSRHTSAAGPVCLPTASKSANIASSRPAASAVAWHGRWSHPHAACLLCTENRMKYTRGA